jgi:hypothetical protein
VTAKDACGFNSSTLTWRSGANDGQTRSQLLNRRQSGNRSIKAYFTFLRCAIV